MENSENFNNNIDIVVGDSRNNSNRDVVGSPKIINIRRATFENRNFRKEIWTGRYMQATVMCIPSGGETGIEMHSNVDQFIKVQQGTATVYFGTTRNNLSFAGRASLNDAIFIPAGTWHNIVNNRRIPLKLYSIYAPPQHPVGTVHQTKMNSDMANQ